MADCTQKLQATVSAAVELWQTGFNSLIVQHVGFNRAVTPLFDLLPRYEVSRCQVSRFSRPPPSHCRPILGSCDGSDVILSTIVTAAMLEVYHVAAVCVVIASCCVWNYPPVEKRSPSIFQIFAFCVILCLHCTSNVGYDGVGFGIVTFYVLALKSGVWQFIHFDHFLRRCSYLLGCIWTEHCKQKTIWMYALL